MNTTQEIKEAFLLSGISKEEMKNILSIFNATKLSEIDEKAAPYVLDRIWHARDQYSQDAQIVHRFFGLSYSSYMVLPRIALQSMPPAWQAKYVALIKEIQSKLPELIDLEPASYTVTCKNSNGKFAKSKMPHYKYNKLRCHDNK